MSDPSQTGDVVQTTSTTPAPTTATTDNTATGNAADETTTSPPAAETTTSTPETTTQPQTTQQPTTTETPTTTNQPQTTQQPTTTTAQQQDTSTSTSATPSPSSSTTIIVTNSEGQTTSTVVVASTVTAPVSSGTATSTSESASSTGVAAGSGSGSSSGGLSTGGKIAIAVVVPIAAVALFIIVGLYFWRKRRARKDEEEQRKEDLKTYAYNPNDPGFPGSGAAAANAGDTYEMKEDTSAGYRGWGTSTLASSVGRKASTTVSGGPAGQPYSDMTNLIQPQHSDNHPGEAIRSDGTVSPEGEILGAMGPPASQNRGGDIRRGPSNASSHYSIGAGSEESEGRGIGVAYSGPSAYQQQPTGYEQYGNANPYSENPYAFAPAPPPGARTAPGPNLNAAELGSAPVIRDNPSRRTTQIQNAGPYVQQPGISQNF